MKNRIGKCVFFGMIIAGIFLYSCFVSRAESAVLTEDTQQYFVKNRAENDACLLSAASRCSHETDEEQVFCVVGENYMPEGSVLSVYFGNDLEYSSTVVSRVKRGVVVYTAVRFAVRRLPQGDGPEEDRPGGTGEAGGQEKTYWQVGDEISRQIGGKIYRFFCIDQDYQGAGQGERQAALFLCDSVIPADTGSFYAYEKQEDGSYSYVFHPGPIVNFGETEEYKTSGIRQWLQGEEASFSQALPVSIGVERSYMGQTKPGRFEALDGEALQPFYLGHQKMTDRLFLLSVEEALRYRSWLWRFGEAMRNGTGNGALAENPETQIQGFS